jgi:hypothetical protein
MPSGYPMRIKFLIAFLLLASPLIGQEIKVQQVAPVVLTSFQNITATVIGTDTKARTCPAEYKVYVRVEGKKPWDDNLYAVQGNTTLMPQGKISYSIVCLRFETPK